MALTNSQAALASHIASLLDGLSPTSALAHEPMRTALRRLFERGDDAFQDQITTWLPRKRKRPSTQPQRKVTPDRKKPWTKHQRETIRTYFAKWRQQDAKGTQPSVNDLERALESLLLACEWPVEEYNKMWTFQAEARTDDGHSRQKRAMDRVNASDSKSQVIESQRRFGILQVEYEVRRLASQLYRQHHGGSSYLSDHPQQSTDDWKTFRSAARETSRLAEREFSKSAETLFSRYADVDVGQTIASRRSARPYLYMVGRYDFGLGLVCMLGNQTRASWERAITNEAISCILQLCEEDQSFQAIVELARKLQPLACAVVEDGFNLCHTNAEELYEPGHMFSAHFQRLEQADLQRSGGLETLAVVAGAMRSDDSHTRLPLVQINPVQEVGERQEEHSAGSCSSAMTEESTVQNTGTGLSIAPTAERHDRSPSDLHEYEGRSVEMSAANAPTSSADVGLSDLWETDLNGWETWTQAALDDSFLDWGLNVEASCPGALISL